MARDLVVGVAQDAAGRGCFADADVEGRGGEAVGDGARGVHSGEGGVESGEEVVVVAELEVESVEIAEGVELALDGIGLGPGLQGVGLGSLFIGPGGEGAVGEEALEAERVFAGRADDLIGNHAAIVRFMIGLSRCLFVF